MKIEERIARRQHTESDPRLVLDYDALSPVVHPDEPVGRGSLVERLLDCLEPAFEGHVPRDIYVWGPKGAGKSAVIRALFGQLDRLIGRSDSKIYTTTRAVPTPSVEFVYVDARTETTGFALLHAVLDQLVSDSVPKQGVGAEAIATRLERRLNAGGQAVIACVDHVNEPESLSADLVFEQLRQFQPGLAALLVGRDPPTETAVGDRDEIQTVHVDGYRRHTLAEVLTSRTSNGLIRSATTHGQLRELATWADGDAHDALAALFGASVIAEQRGHEEIFPADMAVGMHAVPRPGVSLGRVLSLPDSRQRILSFLIDLPESDRRSVGAAADAISTYDIDLSRATIERVLYELAEAGIVRRVKAQSTGTGRPPSRVELGFPTRVFAKLTSER